MENSLPVNVNGNEFIIANNNLLILYDSLSVIEKSLELIRTQGMHEFESVIAQQLRLILMKKNDTHDPYGKNKKKNKQFALIEFLDSPIYRFNFGSEENSFKDAKLFPKIKIIDREYEERMKDSPYFFISEKSFLEENNLTYDEFMNFPLLEYKNTKEEMDVASIIFCIKTLANKAQGAHYQVRIDKEQLEIISQKSRIVQLLGWTICKTFLPIIKQLMFEEGIEIYLERDIFRKFNVYSIRPILAERN